MIELVGLVVLLLRTVSRAENITCSSECSPDPANITEPCNITSGECLFGCIQGHTGLVCSVECPDQCGNSSKRGVEICNAVSKECLFGCKDGFYGSHCTQICSNEDRNCKRCTSMDDNSGVICTECKRNYYRENGECKACNYYCLIKPAEALPTCREKDGYCEFGCREGRYGNTCGFRCNNLCNGACHRDTGRCLAGCSNIQYCGSTCGIICQDGCLSQHCNQSCGCVKGCNPIYWGDKCQHLCSRNCIKPSNPNGSVCDSTNGTCLYGCTSNKHWGKECKKTCSDGCVNGTCQQESGNCMEGCESNTVYGWRCDKPCNKYCLGGTCDRALGYCIEGCVKGWYGEMCDKACNTNCINSTCESVNGSCDNGCLTSFYGGQCDLDCSDRCLKSECERVDGNCTDGCLSGYHGFHCRFVSVTIGTTECTSSEVGSSGQACSDYVANSECDTDASPSVCKCQAGYEANNDNTACHTDILPTESDNSALIGVAVSGWVTSAVLLLVFIIFQVRKGQCFKESGHTDAIKVEEQLKNRDRNEYITLQHGVNYVNASADYETLEPDTGPTTSN